MRTAHALTYVDITRKTVEIMLQPCLPCWFLYTHFPYLCCVTLSYSQVVWADSSEVGCAAHRCDSVQINAKSSWPNALVVVCNYGPGGNYYGQKPYTEGDAGTNCPPDHPNFEKSTGLCVSGRTVEEKEEPEVMIAVL